MDVNSFRARLCIFLTALLTACGGETSSGGGGGIGGVGGGVGGGGRGGIGGTPATIAIPTLTYTAIKTFRFSWTDVADATHYKLLEDPDGVSGFTQVGGDIPQGSQSVDHLVPLYARINAQYILQSCNANLCNDSASVAVSGVLVDSIGYVKASNNGNDDNFAVALSLSSDGNTLAVGAQFEASNGTDGEGDDSAFASGAVYVFTRDGSTWLQQAYLKASNTEEGDVFGAAVTLSGDGNTLAVGAFGEDGNANDGEGDNSAGSSGAVYVFSRSGVAWTQQAYVKASNAGVSDRFGWSVGLDADGNTLVVGALHEDSNTTGVNGVPNDGASASGAAYVFSRNGRVWAQEAYVKASNTDAEDFFGFSVSLSGDGATLVVGANGEDSNATGVDGGSEADNSAGFAGAAYVFTRGLLGWSQQAYIKASNTDGGDQFGIAVSLSANGDTLVVSASDEESNATGIDGDEDNNSATEAGAVYVFSRSGAAWAQQTYVKASNTDADDRFGTAVSLSADGNILAVGARGEASNAAGVDGDQDNNARADAGATYVFNRTGSAWTQQAYVKASNTDAADQFGTAVSLSGNGETLAVGTPLETSNATGIGGDAADNSFGDSGAAYLY